jgi:type VI secretion system protein ImpC
MTAPRNLQLGNINLTSGAESDPTEMPSEMPFRLLVCGNLSGNRADPVPFNQRKPTQIDRDNFDEVLTGLAPSVTLSNPANGADLKISFAELEDFEPDRLFRNLPIFEELRTLQSQLGNPATFQQAAAKIRTWAELPEPAPTPAQHLSSSSAEVLEQLIEADRARSELDDWQRFLRQIAQPHLVEKPDPRQADYALVVENAIGAQMRVILHHPAFQALEAAWRSVFLLVKRLPTDADLQIFVLDASLDELRGDLARDDPSDSVFVRAVLERAVDRPWAVLVSLEVFGKEIADLEVLASMAMLSSRAGTPILAAAAPMLVGCASWAATPDPRLWKPDPAIDAAWEMVRGMEVSRYLGLVTPRFLMRLPYGKDAGQTESFAFEEMPQPEHENYLWGSGAVLCGLLLAEGFVASGWQLNADEGREVNGLPVHVYREEGEACMKPCAEVLLRETALQALSDHGLMVLISLRDRDGVRLHRFQSAAKGTKQLVGPWR